MSPVSPPHPHCSEPQCVSLLRTYPVLSTSPAEQTLSSWTRQELCLTAKPLTFTICKQG